MEDHELGRGHAISVVGHAGHSAWMRGELRDSVAGRRRRRATVIRMCLVAHRDL